MSESSASHRLNDVQDVQDVARMQEESKFFYQFFVDLGALAADFALGSVLSMSPFPLFVFFYFGACMGERKEGRQCAVSRLLLYTWP